MLKREEFAKEFSLIVQQEIKNFSVVVSDIYKAINETKKRVEQVESQSDIRLSAADVSLVRQNIDVQTSLKSIHEKQNVSENSINAIKDSFSRLQDRFENIDMKFSDLEKWILRRDELFEFKLRVLETDLDTCFDKIDLMNDDLNNCIKNTSKKIENVREEIINAPSEAKAVKNEILEKIERDRVDFTGTNKELIFVKTSMHHIKKHLENLYTQIERLKNGVA